jgi:uncharacterized protein
MSTVLITGGTGLIGKAIAKELLRRNVEVIILTRSPNKFSSTDPRLTYSGWDIQKQIIDKNATTKADHIIHLAGENLATGRWTGKQKKKIIESRTLSSALLVKALKENPNKIKTVVSAAAIGWYQTENGMGERHAESDPPANDFLGQTCQQWEASIEPVMQLGKRLVILRTAVALSTDSVVLDRFKLLLRLGFAPILGSGKQIFSWIHLDDLVRMYIFALENESLSGVYNAVAPQPVTNKTFIMELAKRLKGRFFIPLYVPSFALEIVLGEKSVEVLKSNNVSCEKIQAAGFSFLYPDLKSALSKV